MSIKIITDSGCDLDPEVTDIWDVAVIPIPVHFNEKTYLDRKNLFPDEFYRLLENSDTIATTSQITPATFTEEFQKYLKEYDRIIYIAFSSKLSGIYQSALLTKQKIDEEDRITVIDSKSASVGQGLIVKRAVEMLTAGASAEEIIAEINDMVARIQHIFAVGSLEMLKRGGRISSTKALLGNILNIKPILHIVDGEILPLDKVRGTRKVINFFIQAMEERGRNLSSQTIGINYATNPELAEKLKEAITEKFGINDFLISEIGAAIGSHAGPNTLAVFFLS